MTEIISVLLACPPLLWAFFVTEDALYIKSGMMAQKLRTRFSPKAAVAVGFFIAFFVMLAAFALPFGIVFCAKGGEGVFGGAVLLIFALAIDAATAVFYIRMAIKSRKQKRIEAQAVAELKKQAEKVLRRQVHVTVDRRQGSVHPEHPDMVYEVNYGYIKEYTAGDGEFQDAYILDVDEPLDSFDGIVAAVIHRKNDNEDKWVVVPNGTVVTDDEIRRKTDFCEKYFDIEILR